MQTKKMSLANIKGKLSRAEMKKIMAGSGGTGCILSLCTPGGPCEDAWGNPGQCVMVNQPYCCTQ